MNTIWISTDKDNLYIRPTKWGRPQWPGPSHKSKSRSATTYRKRLATKPSIYTPITITPTQLHLVCVRLENRTCYPSMNPWPPGQSCLFPIKPAFTLPDPTPTPALPFGAALRCRETLCSSSPRTVFPWLQSNKLVVLALSFDSIAAEILKNYVG